MHTTSAFTVCLAAVAAAEQQVPLVDKLKGYWQQATAAVSSAVPAAPSPFDATRAKFANSLQHELTLDNWQQVLTVDPTASTPVTQNWLIFITGGNTTCFGMCGNATKAWNTSLPILAAPSNAPKFALLDCEENPVLCNAWSVGPPSLYYFQIPKPLADQSAPAPSVRYRPLNRTTTTIETFKELVLGKELESIEPYEGPFHPFNGFLAKNGLAVPLGYGAWAVSKMPSWLPMIIISLFSRSFMSRRTAPPRQAQPAAAPAQ